MSLRSLPPRSLPLRALLGVLLGAALLLPLSLALAGCQVDSYCLDCKRGDGGGDDDDDGDGGDRDGGDDGDAIDSGGPPDACVITGVEVCDGLDNDCNGAADDGVLAQVGEACQLTLPAPCTPGIYECVAGELICGGAVVPKAESCNLVDDDCDGVTDDGDPGGGGSCGVAEGDCVPGINHCLASGVLDCVGDTPPTTEQCDNRDNDCDGTIDNGNPGGGASCGQGAGICTPGTIMCAGGVLRCEGAMPPTLEQCDGLDNDCDGPIDEGFNLMTDKNNCGTCGHVCTAANASTRCTGGNCAINFCLTDYWDKNGLFVDGCEYNCEFQGNEACNGVDDDCDGVIDEGVIPPNICADFGECASTVATCTGLGGWVCNYPATVSLDGMGNITPEGNCDNKDNDCDAVVDEAFPLKGTACAGAGVGVCQGTGVQACNATQNGLTCNITTPGLPSSVEVCDGKDNDCDGTLDDNAKDNWIAITGGGVSGTKYIFQYEATRPNATAGAQGTMTHRACSRPDVLPWTNVTHPQATAACAAAGGRLCSETEWQRACQTASTCKWGMTGCNTYAASSCNGNDFDFDGIAGNGDQDGLLATKARPLCYADWGAVATRIFDMSGNAKEWTTQSAPSGEAADPANTRRLRGGSFNNTANGISCDLRFAVADDTFQFPNVGFRCCRDSAPP